MQGRKLCRADLEIDDRLFHVRLDRVLFSFLFQVISLQKILPCLLHFGEDQKQLKYFKPKFILDGMFEGLALNPVCARMCPPMTTRNFSSYQPLLAVGMWRRLLIWLNRTSLKREINQRRNFVRLWSFDKILVRDNLFNSTLLKDVKNQCWN